MSRKAALIPIITLFVVLLGIACGIALKSGRLNHEALVRETERGLRELYVRSNPQQGAVSATAVRNVLLTSTDGTVPASDVLPNFLKPEDVFVPSMESMITGDSLVCAVHLSGDGFYAITGKGLCHEIAEPELRNWPHQTLAEAKKTHLHGDVRPAMLVPQAK